jgi:uncharacterized protein (DUF2141 family)
MIRIILVLTLMICSTGAFYGKVQETADPPAYGFLYVEVIGCKNDKGTVRIALCNSEQNYLSGTVAFRGDSLRIVNRQAGIVFRDIPYGEYGVKVYHDENGDGKLTTGLMGIPLEAYGFSNNARGRFGPPKWSVVKFRFESSSDSMVIQLK